MNVAVIVAEMEAIHGPKSMGFQFPLHTTVSSFRDQYQVRLDMPPPILENTKQLLGSRLNTLYPFHSERGSDSTRTGTSFEYGFAFPAYRDSAGSTTQEFMQSCITLLRPRDLL